MNYVLRLFNTGQITLPKNWRNKFDTKNYTAIETKDWLLIKPILDKDINSSIYYETKDGNFGIYSEKGIDPEDILSAIKWFNNG